MFDGTGRFSLGLVEMRIGTNKHVKLRRVGLLTTQLYFPNEPANLRDGLFQRELLMRIANAGDGLSARFDFVLNIRD